MYKTKQQYIHTQKRLLFITVAAVTYEDFPCQKQTPALHVHFKLSRKPSQRLTYLVLHTSDKVPKCYKIGLSLHELYTSDISVTLNQAAPFPYPNPGWWC